ncbi:MAG TPA: VanZ family protein [Vicinamibacterales bacterium]|nr:VanZ family protein [Vicinamibacterales bacterium]
MSVAVVLSAPFMGRLQSLLRSSLSARAYVIGLGVLVGAAIAGAIVVAFLRIRERRGRRLAVMAAAIVIGAIYTAALSTGDPEQDAVERVHFLEYGMIAVLFYRVWRPSTTLGAGRTADPSAVVLPVLCAFAAGTLDEWLQWFIPYRVGETHDVILNLTAIVCGTLFGIALEPPRGFTWRLQRPSMARLGIVVAVVGLIFAGFVSSVHLGHRLTADGIGAFMSRHTVDELQAAERDRSERWLTAPPVGIRRLSREDQYLDEGVWHVRERNRKWDEGDVTAAWRENLILERFFVPVLDRSTYVSVNGNRWPPEHRADAEARADHSRGDFVSVAEPYPILDWNKTVYWLAVLTAAALVAAAGVIASRRT